MFAGIGAARMRENSGEAAANPPQIARDQRVVHRRAKPAACGAFTIAMQPLIWRACPIWAMMVGDGSILVFTRRGMTDGL
jgi:hypothetical protein